MDAEKKAEKERRIRVLTADRQNYGLTPTQESEFINLKKELERANKYPCEEENQNELNKLNLKSKCCEASLLADTLGVLRCSCCGDEQNQEVLKLEIKKNEE